MQVVVDNLLNRPERPQSFLAHVRHGLSTALSSVAQCAIKPHVTSAFSERENLSLESKFSFIQTTNAGILRMPEESPRP